MISLLQWDSDTFGIKIGKLSLELPFSVELFNKEVGVARQQGYRLLYIIDTELPNSILSDHLFLADQKVIYSKVITKDDHMGPANPEVISLSGFDDFSEILPLAYESGKYSRFNLDKRFPKGSFEKMYGIWIKRSLSREIADNVLAYRLNEHYVGLLTYKSNPDATVIGLVAMNPDYAGKGLGSKLMNMFYQTQPPSTKVTVATQKANTPACNYYKKCGYSVKKITNIYHFWL